MSEILSQRNMAIVGSVLALNVAGCGSQQNETEAFNEANVELRQTYARTAADVAVRFDSLPVAADAPIKTTFSMGSRKEKQQYSLSEVTSWSDQGSPAGEYPTPRLTLKVARVTSCAGSFLIRTAYARHSVEGETDPIAMASLRKPKDPACVDGKITRSDFSR